MSVEREHLTLRLWLQRYTSARARGLARAERVLVADLALRATPAGRVELSTHELADMAADMGMPADQLPVSLKTLAAEGWTSAPCWGPGGVQLALTAPVSKGALC